MIRDWRLHAESFGGNKDIPFVFVQLQPCGIAPEMRYAQALSLTVNSKMPNVGMAACFDLGDSDPKALAGECHSRYKMECGRRLALQTLSFLPPSLGGVVSAANTASSAPAHTPGGHTRGAKFKQHKSNTISDHHPNSTTTRGDVGGDVGGGGGGGTTAVAGPTVLSAAFYAAKNKIILTIENGTGTGMHWRGTTQCTRCCGLSNVPVPRGQTPPPFGGKGLTNSYPMQVLDGNGWHYITAGQISIPEVNSTAGVTQYVIVPGAPSADAKGRPYFAVSKLRYAWEDFPECAIYNSDGLPMPPFNLTLAKTATIAPTAADLTWDEASDTSVGAGDEDHCQQQDEKIVYLERELEMARNQIAQLQLRALSKKG